MPVPHGFIEVNNPTFVDGSGRGFADISGPDRPAFARGFAIPKEMFLRYGASQLKRPQWVGYLGPYKFSELPRVEQSLSEWLLNWGWFWLKQDPALVLPDGVLGYKWPFKAPALSWVFEQEEPARFENRNPNAPLGAGTWVAVPKALWARA